MRRFLIACLALPMALLLAVGPVAADTTPGNGTFFGSFTTSCSTSGGRQVCTDTNVSVGPNEDGTTSSACLDIFTYSFSSNGRFTFISDQFGCADGAGLTVGSDLSVTLAPTDIFLATCKAHKRSCTGAAIVTVSASDSVVGDIATTVTRSTTKVGSCTFRTTVTETSAQMAGTLTIDSTTLNEDGFISIVDQTSTEHCK